MSLFAGYYATESPWYILKYGVTGFLYMEAMEVEASQRARRE